MDSLQQASARVRSLLAPARQFASCTKIYEPESDDPQAPLKREIQEFAVRTIGFFECDKLPTRTELAAFKNKSNEYQAKVESDVTEPDKQDYFVLLTAIDQLIAAAAQRKES